MKLLRAILTLFLFASIFWLGYQRKHIDRWAEKKFGTHQSFKNVEEKYTTSTWQLGDQIKQNYKWMFAFLYSILFALATLAIVHVVFLNSHATKVSAVILGLLFVSIFLIILIGNLFGSYRWGYGLAQNIKSLIQSPILPLFFILYFWKLAKKP